MSIEELWIQLQLAGVRFLLLRLVDSTVSLSELDKKAFRSIYKFYDGSSYTSRPCFLVKLDEIQKFQPLKIKDCEKTQWWWFHFSQFHINPTHTKTNYDLGLFYKSKMVFNTGSFENVQELIKSNLQYNDTNRYHTEWDTQ